MGFTCGAMDVYDLPKSSSTATSLDRASELVVSLLPYLPQVACTVAAIKMSAV